MGAHWGGETTKLANLGNICIFVFPRVLKQGESPSHTGKTNALGLVISRDTPKWKKKSNSTNFFSYVSCAIQRFVEKYLFKPNQSG